MFEKTNKKAAQNSPYDTFSISTTVKHAEICRLKDINFLLSKQ